MLPIHSDLSEADSVHELLLGQVLAKNPILVNAGNLTKQCILRIKEYAEKHRERDENILGKKGEALLQQVLNKIE